MSGDYKKMQDLMDRVDGGRPPFGAWSTAQDMAEQARVLYRAQGLEVDEAQLKAFSNDVFNGVERLPLTLPEAYVTPRERTWRKLSRLCSNILMGGMGAIFLAAAAFTFFGPDRPAAQVPAMVALIGCLTVLVAGSATCSLFFALLGLTGHEDEARRSEDTMRKLLDASSTCAIEDLLRNPDRTRQVEQLALESLRRRALRHPPQNL